MTTTNNGSKGGNVGAAYVHGKDNRCHWCERELLSRRGRHQQPIPDLFPTRDHVEPRSKGGVSWVWACNQCNTIKDDMSEAEWRQLMATHPRWWERHRRPDHKEKKKRKHEAAAARASKVIALYTVEAVAKVEYPNDPEKRAAFIAAYKKAPQALTPSSTESADVESSASTHPEC